jgi:hypothetical protein
MKTLMRRCIAGVCVATALIILYACVAGGGYEGGGEVAYGADFYEPFGYEYGGWGPNYRVGPPRGGERRPEHSGGSHPPAYHPAPPSRGVPSIPSRPRGH